MKRFEKSTFPKTSPIGGIRTSDTNVPMIVPKAAPMMMPTAMSMTLPRMANSLNSFSMSDPLSPGLLRGRLPSHLFPRSKKPVRGLFLLRFLRLCVLHLDGGGGHSVLDRHLGADLQIPRDLRVGSPADLPLVLPLLHHDEVVLDLEDGARHLVGLRPCREGERGDEQDGANDQEHLLHLRSPFRLCVQITEP